MDKKRRRAPAAKSEPRKGQKAAAFEWNPEDDEEIVSSDDEVMESDEEGGRKASRRQIEEEEEEEETADEKRARLAKEYIQKIRGAVAPGPDGGDVDAVVTDRLRQDVLATRGDQHAAVAHQLDGITIGSEAVSVRRGHMVRSLCKGNYVCGRPLLAYFPGRRLPPNRCRVIFQFSYNDLSGMHPLFPWLSAATPP